MSAGSALSLLVAYLMGNITGISDLSHFIQQVSHKANGWYILITVQAIGHLFSYLIPALAYWYYFERARWRDFQKQPLEAVSALWMGLLSVVTLIPFNERVINWNQHLELLQVMRGVEEWMREKEQVNGALTNQLTAFTSADQFVMALLVIGGVASVGEEVFFRGIIQSKLTSWTKNRHIGIWLAALFFSAAHMQFYGFYPRLLLGVLFGYLYVWSGNLWVAILAHFLNNSLVVITTYLHPQSIF